MIGFDAVKTKLERSIRRRFPTGAGVRQAIGDEIKLMVDVNTVWDIERPFNGANDEELNVEWLEEPLHPFDVGRTQLESHTDADRN